MTTVEYPTKQQPTDLSIVYGPMIEQTQLSCSIDDYKFSMSQLDYLKHPDVQTTFTLQNRNAATQRLADYVDPEILQARFDQLRAGGWQPEELDYLATIHLSDGRRKYSDEYIAYLASHELPPVNVSIDPQTNDLAVSATGDLPLVSFWETIVMNEVSELYFHTYVSRHGLDVEALYTEGDRRLDEKISVYNQIGHPVTEFGTRRRASLRWQQYVTSRYQTEMKVLAGTSNTGLARMLGLKAVGTVAHQEDMVYAGIADATGGDIRSSHNQMLRDWYDLYGRDLSIALSDTFTSDFFFNDFTAEQARDWRGTRHDSGDPFEYTDKALAFYQFHGIDPKTKEIMFSDQISPALALKVSDYVAERIQYGYGPGTSNTNDFGIKEVALNIVMKATHVRLPSGQEADLVKLSDNDGKHTGNEADVHRYQSIFYSSPILKAVS